MSSSLLDSYYLNDSDRDDLDRGSLRLSSGTLQKALLFCSAVDSSIDGEKSRGISPLEEQARYGSSPVPETLGTEDSGGNNLGIPSPDEFTKSIVPETGIMEASRPG